MVALRKFQTLIGSQVHTDEWWGYRGLSRIFKHKYINHGSGEYSKDGVHTNSNKLSPDYYGNFTEPEKEKLMNILNEMRNDMDYLPSLSGTTDNFNEALKLIAQKEV